MYDIHCHILFGCDDGAEDIETAVEMVRLASKRGTKGIAATPHSNIQGSYINHWGENTKAKFDLLCSEVKARGIDVELFTGQEIFCTNNTAELLKSGSLITLNNSVYPLVEFDFLEYSESAYFKINTLTALGLVPVIAHPERYAFVAEDTNAAAKLKNMGCILQVNKGSLEGKFGAGAFYASHAILSKRLADVVASDAHSPYMRTPNMRHSHELICEEYSYEYADLLLKENPYRILQNKETIQF